MNRKTKPGREKNYRCSLAEEFLESHEIFQRHGLRASRDNAQKIHKTKKKTKKQQALQGPMGHVTGWTLLRSSFNVQHVLHRRNLAMAGGTWSKEETKEEHLWGLHKSHTLPAAILVRRNTDEHKNKCELNMRGHLLFVSCGVNVCRFQQKGQGHWSHTHSHNTCLVTEEKRTTSDLWCAAIFFIIIIIYTTAFIFTVTCMTNDLCKTIWLLIIYGRSLQHQKSFSSHIWPQVIIVI